MVLRTRWTARALHPIVHQTHQRQNLETWKLQSRAGCIRHRDQTLPKYSGHLTRCETRWTHSGRRVRAVFCFGSVSICSPRAMETATRSPRVFRHAVNTLRPKSCETIRTRNNVGRLVRAQCNPSGSFSDAAIWTKHSRHTTALTAAATPSDTPSFPRATG